MTVSKPTITNTVGNYHLDFSDDKVAVRVDRISENSKFETTGEITISSRIPGSTGHLHRARLNLTSSPSRKAMSNVHEDIQPGVPAGECDCLKRHRRAPNHSLGRYL